LARGRERDVAGRRLLALADDLLDLLRTASSEMPRRLQRLGGDALTLVDEPEQDVLGADVVVVEHARLFLRQHDHPAGPVGEPFEHGPTIYCRRIYTQTSHAAIPELSLGTYPMRLPVSTGAKKDFT
jgi:hypothetical protein